MSNFFYDQERFQKTFLLVLVIGISIVFLAMIRQFILALLLGAIFSGLIYPLYGRLVQGFKGKRGLASFVTLLIMFLVVLIPMAGFIGIVVAEAVQVTETVRPWIERQIEEPNQVNSWLETLPFYDRIQPYNALITEKLGELAGNVGNFLVESLAAVTTGTATFFFQLFIMLYAMFFFLMNGPAILDRILYYMPLSSDDEHLMLSKFVKVTMATVKGTIVIGAVQGLLAGLGFWVAGIPSATFWGTVMAVLSVIPALGAALVWIPGVIYLIASGDVGAGIGLAIWCAAVVGTVDNFMRPRMVGRDTQMHDLFVLLGTLGGIALFGIVGIIIGPILAALFITIWELYGIAFKDILPEARPLEEVLDFSDEDGEEEEEAKAIQSGDTVLDGGED